MNDDSVKITAELDDQASPSLKMLIGLFGEFVKGVKEGAKAELEATKVSENYNNSQKDTAKTVDDVTVALAKKAAAFFSVKLVVDQFIAAVSQADKLDDLADKTGIAANELKDLGYAAKIGGSSLEGLLGAFSKLGRSAVMSEEDTKKQTKAFEDLGIAATDANGQIKDSNALFLEIADKFKNLQDGPEKSAIAFRLFGSEAKNLIPLLNKGSEGILALKKESQELGGVAPGAFDAFAKAAGDLFDGIDKVKTIFEGFFTTLGADLVPIFNVIIEQFVSSAKEGGLLRSVLDGITTVVKNVLVPAIQVAAVVFDAFTSTVKIAGKSIGALFAVIGAIASGGGLKEVKSIMTSYGEDVAKVANDHEEFSKKLALAGHESVKLAEALDKPKEKLKATGKGAKDVKSSLQEMVAEMRIANQAFGMDESVKQGLELRKKYAEDIKKGFSQAQADALLREGDALINVNEALRKATAEQEAFDKARLSNEEYQAQTDLIQYEATLIGLNADERARLIEKFKEEAALRKTVAGLTDEDAKRIADETRALQDARDAALQVAKETRITNEILDQSRAAVTEDVSTRIQAAAKLLEAGKITVDDYNTYQLSQLERLKDKNKQVSSEVQEFWKAAAQGIQGDLGNFFFDAMQGKLGNLAVAFKNTFDRIVANILAAKAATALFGEGFAKGNTGGILGAAGSYLSGLFRAEGGPVTAGQPYIVGERRAEVFVPSSSGKILPSTDGMMQGGGNTTMNFAITAMDSQSVIQNIDKHQRQIAEIVNNATRKYNLA